MGCFTYTCAISGLPIEAGDKIRAILLTSTPFPEEDGDLWRVRSNALRGTYNDYGSFDLLKSDTAHKVWLEVFKRDLIEVGTGDNTCHDVAVTKDSSFEELLTALWERRVHVNNRTTDFDMNFIMSNVSDALQKLADTDPELAKLREEMYKKGLAMLEKKEKTSLPMLKHVIDTIKSLGINVHEGQAYPGGSRDLVLVDEPDYHGSIRVGVMKDFEDKSNSKNIELLGRIQAAFPQFPSMIAQATGSYRDGPELTLRKPFSPDEFHLSSTRNLENKSRVHYCMVREDVWKELLKIRVNRDHCRNHSDEYCYCLKGVKALPKEESKGSSFGIYGLLPSFHLKTAVKMGLADKKFHEDYMELQYIDLLVNATRRLWNPTIVRLGSQDANFNSGVKLMTALKKVAILAKKAQYKKWNS
jgi:hypothetical protein